MAERVGYQVESWSIRPLGFQAEVVPRVEARLRPARRIARAHAQAHQEVRMRGRCRRRVRSPCRVAAYVDAKSNLAAEVPLTTVMMEQEAERRSACPCSCSSHDPFPCHSCPRHCAGAGKDSAVVVDAADHRQASAAGGQGSLYRFGCLRWKGLIFPDTLSFLDNVSANGDGGGYLFCLAFASRIGML